jgi:hypothetical protein
VREISAKGRVVLVVEDDAGESHRVDGLTGVESIYLEPSFGNRATVDARICEGDRVEVVDVLDATAASGTIPYQLRVRIKKSPRKARENKATIDVCEHVTPREEVRINGEVIHQIPGDISIESTSVERGRGNLISREGDLNSAGVSRCGKRGEGAETDERGVIRGGFCFIAETPYVQ